ncbi:MAG: hypothetical protein H6750_10980 [Nitrospiraceae bacterium]|nr:hypothetical protein [Nitrospira sp.]MCA9458056.1 hypothetical protein [Nitrospira sp.]MCB9774833.1 hypothetical protein [Nitrospiraceae bacterium]
MKSGVLEIMAAKLALGLLISTDLPDLATKALEEGYDSPSLRILAGLNRASDTDEVNLLKKAFHELDVEIPESRDAVLYLSRNVAEQIVRCEISKYEGARKIWDLSLRPYEENIQLLDPFIYALSEWDERPDDQPLFEKMIMSAAQDLLSESS